MYLFEWLNRHNSSIKAQTFDVFVNPKIISSTKIWRNRSWIKLSKEYITRNEATRGNLATEYLKAKFVNRSSITDYTLRDTMNKLAMPKLLPLELRQTESLSFFEYSLSKDIFGS